MDTKPAGSGKKRSIRAVAPPRKSSGQCSLNVNESLVRQAEYISRQAGFLEWIKQAGRRMKSGRQAHG